MKRITRLILLMIFTWSISSLSVFAGEGYESIIHRWMKRGNMTETEIQSALKLPREIKIVESINAILPGPIFYISKDGRSGYKFYIRDTIWGEKVFPKEVFKK